jgi:AcrR family transcriptional regulator
MITNAARARRDRPTARGAASRDRILEAAAEILTERGYAGTSISAVCDRADISPTSIYWHFGSKGGLLQQLLERMGRRHVEGIQSAASEVRDPLERLDRLIASLSDLVKRQPLGALSLVASISEGERVTPEMSQAFQRVRSRETKLLIEGIEEALQQRVPDLDVVATLGAACANYAALSQRAGFDESEIDHIFEALRRAIVLILGHHLPDEMQRSLARAEHEGEPSGQEP